MNPDSPLFDREISYTDVDTALPESMEGQTLQVCTVRQRRMKDMALGNLYWLLQASKAHRRGAKIVITDFHDRPNSKNKGTTDLVAALGLEGDRVTIQRAEDVPLDMHLWRDITHHIREYGMDELGWAMIGRVQQGVEDVLADDGEGVPPSMERLIEELSVWVDGIDDDTVTQLMNHELQSTRWVRLLRPNAQKAFWNVDLPWENEYRGRYKDVSGPNPIITQRRLQDLAGKLAAINEEPPEHAAFYQNLFDELITELRETERAHLDRNWSGPEEYKYGCLIQTIGRKLANIDPRLIPFFIPTLEMEDRRMLIPPRGMSGFDSHENKPLLETALMIISAELRSATPSLQRVIAFADKSKGYWFNSDELSTALLDPRFSDEDVVELWNTLITSSMEISPRMFSLPASDRIAKMPSETKHWRTLRDTMMSDKGSTTIGSILQRNQDPYAIPLLGAFTKDLTETAPDQAYELIKLIKKKRALGGSSSGSILNLERPGLFVSSLIEELLANPDFNNVEAARELLQQIRTGKVPEARRHRWY